MAGPIIVRGSAPPPDVVPRLPAGTTDFYTATLPPSQAKPKL